MSCSDNVVRAGLTPKYRDKDTLCHMLTYVTKTASENIFKSKPHPEFPSMLLYDPPTPEFAVARVSIPVSDQYTAIPVIDGPSIVIALEGQGSIRLVQREAADEISKGDVLFVPAGCQILLNSSLGRNLLIFQAFCQIKH